jgi:hypothetical protein
VYDNFFGIPNVKNQSNYLPGFSYANFTKLKYLNVGFNNQLQTASMLLPGLSGATSLMYLNAGYNDNFGPLPDFSNLVNMVHLDMSYSSHDSGLQLTNWSKLTKLEIFSAWGALIAEPLPDSLVQIPSLKELDLHWNFLYSSLPANWNLPNLRKLSLANNSFTGPIPRSIFTNSPLISIFEANGNQFNTTGLCDGYLENDSIVNPIAILPPMMPKLASFDISSNLIDQSTTITSFMKCLSQATQREYSLLQVSLSMLRFQGQVSESMLSWKDTLYSTTLSGNSASPGTAGQYLNTKYIATRSLPLLPGMMTFKATDNQLSGPINSLDVGQSSIKTFDMSNNKLNGTIPYTFPLLQEVKVAGNMFVSERLDSIAGGKKVFNC